jgi:D-tagatose-1,6-bisphosphate aldolase subunit GatZ/KbaZ
VHSTDFQTGAALSELVATHFAILKVGPALTFAFREAVFALAEIEARLDPKIPSRIVETLERAMDAQPRHWRGHVAPGPGERLLRLYGLSDRIRYYWSQAEVQAALERLVGNVDSKSVAPGLISQFAGESALERSEQLLSRRVIAARIGSVVAKYRRACGQAARCG